MESLSKELLLYKTPKDVGLSYDYIHDRYLLSLGEFPDITSAFYNGNFKKTYFQAQKDKHEYVLKGVDFKSGDKVLDIGSGWGPMLKVIKDKEGIGIGLTISKKQAKYCRKRNLEVLLQDWKETDTKKLGKFDSVISIGAFEHFCSIDEYLEGIQEDIYKEFFHFCHNSLKDGGKLYLQTMTCGDKVPKYPEEVNINAPKRSDERIIGNITCLFPNSWLPTSKDQILKCSENFFDLIDINNGRQDYIRTFTEIDKAWHSQDPRKNWLKLKTFGKYIIDSDFRKNLKHKLEAIEYQHFREAFIRHLIDHYRMFFKKK